MFPSSPIASTEATGREDFTELLILFQATQQRAFWVFALYNTVGVREEVAEAIRRVVAPTPVFTWTYTPENPYPISYLDQLTEEQKRNRAVVFFFDLERGDDKAWKSLDYNREYFAEQPHGFVFWVTTKGRVDAALKAPHFWAQRTGVFDFTVPLPERQAEMRGEWAGRPLNFENYDDALRELRLYQGLYDEYASLPDTPPATLADAAGKTARALNYLDRREEAVPYLEQQLEIARRLGDPDLQAEALINLANVESIRTGGPAAIELLEEARSLANRPELKANVLFNLGSLAFTQGRADECLKMLEEAQALFKQVGAKLGQANVYLALARMNDDEENFKRALELYEEIRDNYSIARGKYYFGLFKVDAGEIEEGVKLLQESRNGWAQVNFDPGVRLIDERLTQLAADN